MTLLYKVEHLSCISYSADANRIFHVLTLVKGNTYTRRFPDSTFLVILISGNIKISYGINQYLEPELESMFLLPKNFSITYTANEDSVLLLCTLSTELKLCSRYSIEQLASHIPSDAAASCVYSLPLDSRIRSYSKLLVEALQEGLGCMHFHLLKRDELLLYLRAGYSKEKLARFFYPILGGNIEFKDFVLAHYVEVSDVKELAAFAKMSLSTFNRRFKETFNETAQKWLLKRKSERLLRDIVMSELSFSEIAFKYKFSSPAYLTTFCKKNFGATPYVLREKGSKQATSEEL
ncbi:helix-turn-helix transcriptional regulator [uncultured Bacteroides sp.]|uniref:helix-turn-helix transcriptional regulator n=1 Tax=uncultured Bacteroides sp. TaxID=162156 RepID=UPI00261D9277|nr:helix-turn-helix transcriptional regulator [uncultured Bacteroides sp.]